MTHQQIIRRAATMVANVASDLDGKEGRVTEAMRLDEIAQQLRDQASMIQTRTRRIQRCEAEASTR